MLTSESSPGAALHVGHLMVLVVIILISLKFLLRRLYPKGMRKLKDGRVCRFPQAGVLGGKGQLSHPFF